MAIDKHINICDYCGDPIETDNDCAVASHIIERFKMPKMTNTDDSGKVVAWFSNAEIVYNE